MNKLLFVLPLVALMACEKEVAVSNAKLPNDDIVYKEDPKDPKGKLKVTMKIARAIEERPRDLKKCDCLFCFGACDIKIGGGVESGTQVGVVSDSTAENKAKLFILEDLPQAESEFGVDFDLDFPAEVLTNTSLTFYQINAGMYNYIPKIGTININGVDETYYGYVEVHTTGY
jgi:hypothetical protein